MTFRAKKRISDRESHKLVLAMALHGNHLGSLDGNFRNVADVKAHCAQNGIDFAQLTRGARDFSKHIPLYENLIGAQWVAEGVIASKANHITGDQEVVVNGEGIYNESNYWANFEISREDFDSAIESGRWERLLSAVNAGIASVEAFLNHQYMIRFRVAGDCPDLRDSLEKKIKEWPEMLSGRPFDLSGRPWALFCKLKKLRDDDFQHRKSVSTGVDRKQHILCLNDYRRAIPRLLLDLHVHFNVRCPSSIIRYAHYPEIEMAPRRDP